MAKILVVGCGTMGEIFARHLAKDHFIILCDRDYHWAKQLATELKVQSSQKISEIIKTVDVVILAIKPQDLDTATEKISGKLSQKQLVISLLTGTPLAKLKKSFNPAGILRIVPNLSIRENVGIIGCSGLNLTSVHRKVAFRLLSKMGTLYWIEEEKLNAFTSLIGSGPAFVYVIVESMVDAAIAMGLKASLGQELVQKMIIGALISLKENQKHPGALKWEMASPGGTTITGLKAMEEGKVRSDIINTFLAAYGKATSGN